MNGFIIFGVKKIRRIGNTLSSWKHNLEQKKLTKPI